MKREEFKKLASHSQWYFDVPSYQQFFVVAHLDKPGQIPNGIPIPHLRDIPDYIYDREHLLWAVLPIYDLHLLEECDFVRSWFILRKAGLIEFTEEQIYAAYLQHLSEFDMAGRYPRETAEEFRKRDIIGYTEVMGGMERVLYRAVGYL